jgi:RNase H-like domain found in reverse transcriptase
MGLYFFGNGRVRARRNLAIWGVISYAGRLYSEADKRYCVIRKKLFAVVLFLKHFRQYILGKPFLVLTDHAALQ